jgi:deazaflavin-dependent oxidoreductase (nitroreductase family)
VRSTSTDDFVRPSSFERLLNRVFGVMVGAGFGLSHNRLLQVRGRVSGRSYSAPVNILELGGKLYLVCPRGRAQWVQNVLASGRLVLKKGRSQSFAATPVSDERKAEILKQYLDRFSTTVRRFFPVAPGSPTKAFVPYLDRYPVFELTPV